MNRTYSRHALAALAGALAIITSSAVLRGQEDDLARELPRIHHLEPAAALASFKLHAGFRLDPVAVEPLVTDPVSLCYDEEGRAYVVEMRGYPYPENSPTGYVRRLEDRDGDGHFDASTIFVPDLSWPTSVVPYDGGVFIAVAPDILYAKDTNGDGVADVKKVVFSGFGTSNVQALVNGLLWGTDGWIYGVTAGNGGLIRNLSRPNDPPVSVRGRDFRFLPDGSRFEAISGGGQFGHSFDDWGHRFTCSNSNHIRQIVLPSHYLERNPALATSTVITDIPAEGPAAPVYRTSPPEPWRVVRTRQRVADPKYKNLPETERHAAGFFTSATGVTMYRGSAYPAEYRGNAFIGDVGGNLVHRKIVTKNGPIYVATRADQGVEFLTSSDNWFRPVNFANTPNGTLLILDMYRETIEHPWSIPEPIKKHLDLTSGKDRGRLYELLPTSGVKRRHPALGRATTAELVKYLADPDAWWRETAQRLLIERRDAAAVPLLKQLAHDRPSALGRVHALWTLDVLHSLAAGDLLPALKDEDANVREQAARLTEGRVSGSPELLAPLLALAGDPDPMVRFQTAFSLGAVADPKAVEALARIVVRDGADRWVRAAVLSAIAGRTVALYDALKATPDFLDEPRGRVWVRDLADLVGAENRPEAIAALLARTTGEGARPAAVNAVLLGLGRGLQRAGGSLRAVLRGPVGDSLKSVFTRAAAESVSEEPAPARVEAIRLLGLGAESDALRVLPGLLDARQPGEVQLAALQTLSALADPQVGPTVVSRWRALSPAVRREAVEVLFARADRIAALLDALDQKTMAPSDLDPARRKQLASHPNRAIRDRASRLLGRDAQSDRGQVLATNRKALEITGDREKGKAVFQKVCATCHKAEGQGTDVGPNLATITGRTPEDLLIHILEPNREVAPNYVNYNVATADGLIISGIIAEESANAVTLKRAEGVTEVVPRNRIESISSTGLSLMPEGLEKGLVPQDFADLIAYLRSLQAGAPATPPAR
jgi:putative membrane-bound dehydrogenase-like protein